MLPFICIMCILSYLLGYVKFLHSHLIMFYLTLAGTAINKASVDRTEVEANLYVNTW